jgi:glycosyltransferase involved in cell wall biosynthesis
MTDSQEIRVMFVTNSPSGGGAERATNILVNALHENKVKVALTTINHSEPDLVIPTCETFQVDRTWQGGPISVLTAYLRFRGIVKSWKPSHLVLECDLPEFFGSLIKGSFRKIVVLQSSKPWLPRLKFGEIVRERLSNQKALWVAVSNHFNVWNFNSKPDAVISNPLILSNLNSVVQNQIENSINRIVYVGRLSEEKQPEWVLDIAWKCNLPVVLIGDGNLRNTLEEKSSKLDIEINFKGYVSQPWNFISNGDLLVVPSQYEGDGLVIVEAIARRVPILLNDILDLRRFDLPDHYYCSTVSDFASRINENKDSLSNFVVPENTTLHILLDRDPIEIAKKWVAFLSDKNNR